jgi:hypothetical protein
MARMPNTVTMMIVPRPPNDSERLSSSPAGT